MIEDSSACPTARQRSKTSGSGHSVLLLQNPAAPQRPRRFFLDQCSESTAEDCSVDEEDTCATNDRKIPSEMRQLRRGRILRVSRLAIKVFGSGRGGHRLNDHVVRNLNVDRVSKRVDARDFPQHTAPGCEVKRLRVIGRSANSDPCLLTLYHYCDRTQAQFAEAIQFCL